jgi:hypothetical protein
MVSSNETMDSSAIQRSHCQNGFEERKMGVYHFMGLGKSIGAVTCAVDYIEKSLDLLDKKDAPSEAKEFFSSSGGINHEEKDRGKIEAIVLFTSREITHYEKEKAFDYLDCPSPSFVREEIEKNLRSIWKRKNPNEGRKIFWCEVDRDNFEECFDKVLKVTYRFSQPRKQGKEIWCNLTGGANTINLALLSVAQLTGKFTKQYMLSQHDDYKKHIKVPPKITVRPQKDGYFNLLPFVTMSYDTTGFFEVLNMLKEISSPIKTEELFYRLRQKEAFKIDLEHFIKHFMVKMWGLGYTTIMDPENWTSGDVNFEREEKPQRSSVWEAEKPIIRINSK